MPKLTINGRAYDVSEFCQRRHIRRLALFGSVLREDFGPQSDVDVLIEFERRHVPGFFDLMRMQEEMSGILGGLRVDLRTPEDLSRHFRDKVLAEAKTQYERT